MIDPTIPTRSTVKTTLSKKFSKEKVLNMLKMFVVSCITVVLYQGVLWAMPEVEVETTADGIDISIPLSGSLAGSRGDMSIEDTCFAIISDLTTTLRNQESQVPANGLSYAQLESAYNECSTRSYELSQQHTIDLAYKDSEYEALNNHHAQEMAEMTGEYIGKINKLKEIVQVLLSGDQDKIDQLFSSLESSGN